MFITYVVEDLKMCTRPTCRSILGDGIREKKSQPEVFFFRIYKLHLYIPPPPQKLYLEVCHIGSEFFFFANPIA